VTDPFSAQTIAGWVSDFEESATYRELPPAAKEHASRILPVFLESGCALRDVAPGELEEGDFKHALLDGVAALDLPGPVVSSVPALCGALLAELETQGRLAGGRALGRYVRALRPAFEERRQPTPIRNPGSRIGRNDPCPCGSGRKYKQCCMNRVP
jgi:hypothetical protein